MRNFITALFVFFIMSMGQVEAAIYLVAPGSANGTLNSGASYTSTSTITTPWPVQQCYSSMRSAASQMSVGDQMWVKAGTATPAGAGAIVSAVNGRSFYGGFAGTETSPTQRMVTTITDLRSSYNYATHTFTNPYSASNLTVIDCTNLGVAAFSDSSAGNFVIDGFEFTQTGSSAIGGNIINALGNNPGALLDHIWLNNINAPGSSIHLQQITLGNQGAQVIRNLYVYNNIGTGVSFINISTGNFIIYNSVFQSDSTFTGWTNTNGLVLYTDGSTNLTGFKNNIVIDFAFAGTGNALFRPNVNSHPVVSNSLIRNITQTGNKPTITTTISSGKISFTQCEFRDISTTQTPTANNELFAASNVGGLTFTNNLFANITQANVNSFMTNTVNAVTMTGNALYGTPALPSNVTNGTPRLSNGYLVSAQPYNFGVLIPNQPQRRTQFFGW